jgi:predicted Fe-Mo cluster-binding NifX family protein
MLFLVVRVREDKSITDVMTQSELVEYIDLNKGKMQSIKVKENEAGTKHSHLKQISSVAKVKEEYVIASYTGPVNEILSGIEICVIAGGVEDKHQLEKIALSCGALVVANPLSSTNLIIADSLTRLLRYFYFYFFTFP